MITIIICSRFKKLADQISENIAGTIGVDHELIILDNSGLNYPIGVQYNIGATSAKYKYLLFIHEDVHIMTKNWGQILTGILTDKTIGMVGVAGSKYYPDCPGTWPNDKKLTRENIYHKDHHFYENPQSEQLSEVVSLDGMFLACRKDVWNVYRFNEILTGFHFYDLDTCFRILTQSKLKLFVTYDIDINHFSSGNLDKNWIDQSIDFYNKWKSSLPLSVVKVSTEDRKMILKAKAEHLIMLFFFQYNGTNRRWLMSFYLSHLNVLKLSKSIIFVIRYALFGSAQSVINQKLAGYFKK